MDNNPHYACVPNPTLLWYTTLLFMRMNKIQSSKVRGKRVLLRVDYNIEVDRAGKLRDTTRIQATLPTIQWLLRNGAQVILVSHRGRPQGKDRKLSLQPVVPVLKRLTKQSVVFVSTPVFSRATEQAITSASTTDIILLENIRFEAGEEENSGVLAKRLASFADIAVNDAFADSHRAHASIVGVAKYLPMYAGMLLQQEVSTLQQLMIKPKRPYVAIIGGAKISTKLHLIQKLLRQADYVLLGGALANTLLQAEGVAIGASLSEPTMVKELAGLHSFDVQLKLPCDVVVAKRRAPRAPTRITAVGKIAPREMILDIGPDTIELFRRIIRTAKTVVWNGPMGVYELPPFDRGTIALAKAVAQGHATSIAGGGETIDAIRRSKTASRFTFLSTGGGAMLEFLEGKHLPGVVVTQRR